MFGVADGIPPADVLADWTRSLVDELGAAHLFDLPSGPIVYRVFLLPGCLQLDVSVTPASAFGAGAPTFRLLFGSAVDKPHVPPPDADELFGYAVHHALRARVCIERGRCWQAEYWVSGVRDYALDLACRRRGLPVRHGRGFDDLPADVLESLGAALVRSPEPDELLRALACAIDGLLLEAEEARGLAARLELQLRTLAARWDPQA